MARGCIVGWAHTPFGKLEDPDVESLMARVSGEALAHAGLGTDQVDGIYVGVMNSGFSKQGFEGAQVALAHPDLAHVPATHLENACATGSAALYGALDFIESGRGKVALVVGAEKMTATPLAETSDILLAPPIARRKRTSTAALRGCSAASRPITSSVTATAARSSRASPPRTTAMA
jgi:acetyl-CoA C-acetyltransferase